MAREIPVRLVFDAGNSAQDADRFNQELRETSATSARAQRGLDGLNAELGQTSREARGASGALAATGRSTRTFVTNIGNARTAIIGLGTAIGGLQFAGLAQGSARASDQIALLGQRLDVLTGQTGGLERVIELSQRLGTELEGTGDVFARFAIGTRQLGITNDELRDLTEVVFSLGRIGGSSLQDITNASIQLGQALSSGRLQGDELRSVLENLPLVGQRIADSLGASIGQLRELGAEGALTAEVVAGALLGSVEDVREQFAELPFTLDQSRASLSTSWTLLLAELGRSLESSRIFQFFDRELAAQFDEIRGALAEDPRGDIESDLARAFKQQEDAQRRINELLEGGADLTNQSVQTQTRRLEILQDETAELLKQLELFDSQEAARRNLAGALERSDQTFATREPVPIGPDVETKEEQRIRIRVERRAAIESAAAARLEESRQARLQRELDQLERSLLTEEQLIEQNLQDRFDLATRLRAEGEAFEDQARRAELAALAEHELAKAELEERAADERRGREERERQERVSNERRTQFALRQASAGFADLGAELAGRDSALAKSLAIANATIATYTAATQAMADPLLPTPVKYIAAAGIIAAGLANVARIRSTAIPRASGGSTEAGRTYQIDEMGPEVYRDPTGRTYLIPKISGGEVTPMHQTASGGISITMENRGTNARVTRANMIAPGQIRMILETADSNARAAFDDELRHGYGSYAASLSAHTTTRRRVA